MNLRAAGAAGLALALLMGCDRLLLPSQRRIYAAWEEGLTLGFEDPSLPPAQQFPNRQQVRVKTAKAIGRGWNVTRTFSSLHGQQDLDFYQEDGGVLLEVPGTAGAQILPEGFPDRVRRWEARGVFNWVVGRAAADLPGIRFADPADAEGIWVESVAQGGWGPRVRTLYLPDIGEAQRLEWRSGRWVEVNRLVTRGFTDIPGPAIPVQPGSAK